MSLLNVDAINESTSATGVTVEGVLVKDSTLKIPGGSPGADKVLTSDASGNATWVAAASSGFVAVTFYTDTSGTATWSKSTNNPTKIVVEVIGAGGGSGAGSSGSGGSGGAGSYGMAVIDVSTVTTATVTVGAGGTAGSSGAGGTGGTSKFTYATGTGSAFTEMESPGGNPGGHANHTGGSTTSLPTGPTNGVYIAGNGGGGASNSGGVSHGYGASQMGGYTYNYATGYGSANAGTGSATTGRAGMPGLILVWEYK